MPFVVPLVKTIFKLGDYVTHFHCFHPDTTLKLNIVFYVSFSETGLQTYNYFIVLHSYPFQEDLKHNTNNII